MSLSSGQPDTIYSFDSKADHQSLETAFRSFSEVSVQLADSYQCLQDQVSDLQQELVQSNEEKNRASEARQNLATRLAHLLELLPGGVVVLDSFGTVEQCNPAAVDFLGADLNGRRWTEIIEDRFSPRIDDGHEISLRDGRRLSIVTRSMDEGKTGPDAKTSGKGQIILLTDQTQTRELQEQLARRDRLSTMGKMVAYLAHQIRTPLSSAMLYAGHLKNPELDASCRSGFAAKLLRQLKNVESQVSDLLIFARGETAAQQRISVTELFSRLEREVEATATLDSVAVTYANLAAHAELDCNPQTLISAILNLLNNSREASIEYDRGSPVEVTISAEVHDRALTICVADNGPGIAKSSIRKVLEPFYSTRAKGTGLGLAVVQAVAKSLGGNLNLSSGSEGGLNVQLTLPLGNPN